MVEPMHEAVAAGTVAIAGVMALCSELAIAGVLDVAAVKRIGEFMLDATGRSEASPQLQAHLHEGLSHHLATLLAALAKADKSPPKPEAFG